MNYLFPLAFMMNTFSMTALIVILGLSGNSHFAADIAIIQGALAALFFSFSANARSIILNSSSSLSVNSIFRGRLILLLPLALSSYFLSGLPAEANTLLIIVLIIRRCVEWISEIHLAEMELSKNQAFARKFFYLQAAVFIIVVVCLLGYIPMLWLCLCVWALAPLIMSTGFIIEQLKKPVSFHLDWHLMLPQFGSTMIIGISLYIFRLIILLITGKEVAGDLFTAFALGGMLGSIYAQVLGPSVALYENGSTKSFFSPRINVSLGLTILAGTILFVFSQMDAHLLAISNKSNFFWGSVGASIIGGVIMVYAQQIRFRLLQIRGDKNLFGPDLLMNILIIASVPYFYYILGKDTLMILYMISAILAYVFYWSATRQDDNVKQYKQIFINKAIMIVIPFIVLLPVFLQIKSGIFQDRTMNIDSNGVLINLPVPLSALACFIGVLIIGKYRRADLSLSFIFFSVITMIITSIVSTGYRDTYISAKLIFLLQLVLPMFALVLGQQYEKLDPKMTELRKSFFCVLCIMVPLQLLSTCLQGEAYLSPYLYFFSIYQNWQYVPVIFTSAFMLVLYGCWEDPYYKRILMFYLPIMSIYVAASTSTMAYALLLAGTVGYLYHQSRRGKMDKVLIYLLILIIALSTGYSYIFRAWSNSSSWNKIQVLRADKIENLDLSINRGKSRSLSDRITIWKFYIKGSVKDTKTFFMGNAQRPDRSKYSSAHNYYLDFLYNFGFLSILPMICLISFTVYSVYRCRKEILSSPSVLGLVIVVFFIIFVDNSIKVGLRQPYSGIFSFFLWGLLLSKLLKMPTNK